MRDDRVCELEYKELRTTMVATVKVVNMFQLCNASNLYSLGWLKYKVLYYSFHAWGANGWHL